METNMKKYLAYIFIVFVLALLTGCGSNGVYDLDNSIYSEVDVDEQGGIDKVLPNGFRVTAEAGTFANEKSIRLIITEEEGAAFISKDYLKQVSRIYYVRALTSDGVYLSESSQKINLVLPNSATWGNDVFVGSKIDGEDWSFQYTDGPILNEAGNNKRFSNSASINYGLHKLNNRIAVFEHKTEEGQTIPIVSDVSLNLKKSEISVKDNKYKEDLIVPLIIRGVKLDSAKAEDYKVKISYSNKNSTKENIKVTGGVPTYSIIDSGLNCSDIYTHKIEINNLNDIISNNSQTDIKFSLGLKDIDIQTFPQDFSIEVENTKNTKVFDKIPFNQNLSVKLTEKAVPAPENVIASYNSDNQTVNVNWDWAGTDSNVDYKLTLQSITLSTFPEMIFTVKNSTNWDSSNANLALQNGDYVITIAASTSAGVSIPSEITDNSKFTVLTPDTLTAPSLKTLQSEYLYGSAVKASWIASKYVSSSGLTGDITYDLYLDRNNPPTTILAENLSELQYEIPASGLSDSGIYYIQLVAKCNDLTTSSEVVSFTIAEPAEDVLTAPVLNEFNTEYPYGNVVKATWTASRLESLKGSTGEIKYAVILDKKFPPVATLAEDIAILEYDVISENQPAGGNYFVKVIASCNELQSSSEIKSFTVSYPVIEKPVVTVSEIITSGNDINICWNSCNNAFSYNVYVYKSDAVLPEQPTATITDGSLIWNAKNAITETGTYNVVVEALNGEIGNKSEAATFRLGLSPLAPINLSVENINFGNAATINWEAGNAAEDVIYTILIGETASNTNALSWQQSDYLAVGNYDVEISARNDFGVSASSTAHFVVNQNSLIAKITPESFIDSKVKLKPTIEIVFDHAICDSMKSYMEENIYVTSAPFAEPLDTAEKTWLDTSSPTMRIEFSKYLTPLASHRVVLNSDALTELTELGMNINGLTGGILEFETILWEGSGTESDPYKVACAKHLDYIREYLNACYLQVDDIDLALSSYQSDNYTAAEGWLGIGNYDYENEEPFKGKYDGNGYVINNLTIIRPGEGYVGLFAYTEDAQLKNICLTNASVYGGEYVSGIIAYAKTTSITDSSVLSSQIVGEENIGGIMGENEEGSIYNCFIASSTMICSENTMGGITSYNDGEMVNCYAYNLTAQGYEYTGGLMGYNAGITNGCYIESSEIFSEEHGGGLISCNFGNVENSYVSNVTINGESWLGGFIAGSEGTASCCYVINSTVTGNDGIGGFVACIEYAKCYNCYVLNTEVSGNDEVGGFAGDNAYAGYIYNCYVANTSVTGATNTGALIGFNNHQGYAYDCFVAKNITLTVNGSNINDIGSQLVGYDRSLEFSDISNLENIYYCPNGYSDFILKDPHNDWDASVWNLNATVDGINLPDLVALPRP